MEKNFYDLESSEKTNNIPIKFKNNSDEVDSTSNSSFKVFKINESDNDFEFSNLVDTYTKQHSDRVSQYAILIGKHIGLSNEDLKNLKLGCLFHDVGKSEISNDILQKTSSLDDSEYSKMKKHPLIGATILYNSNHISNDIITIVEHHHEKYDGTGYPSGLKGKDIPYLARIATIADSFDAMTSKRSYRNPLSMDVAISELEKCKGTQFDPELTDVFLDILKNNIDDINKIQKKYDL